MAAAAPYPEGPPPDDVEALGPPGDPESAARTIALTALTHKARSRSELMRLLLRRGIPEQTASDVLARLAGVGLVDDPALAREAARAAHAERGLSRRAIAVALRRRGIEEADVEAAVEPIDAASERAAALDLATRRARTMRGLAPEVQARRLFGLLARRGYPPGLASAVVRDVIAEFEVPDLD